MLARAKSFLQLYTGAHFWPVIFGALFFFFSAETANHIKQCGGHMLLIGRDYQDLGLVWLLSPLTWAASGKAAHSWALSGSYVGRDVSAPGSSPLLAEISPRLIPNSLGVQGAQLLFGLIAIFFSKVAVTAVERHRFLKYSWKYSFKLSQRALKLLLDSQEAKAAMLGMNEWNVPHPPLKFVCAQSCHAWDSPASPSQAFGVSSDALPSFCFLHLHTSACVFRVALQWE